VDKGRKEKGRGRKGGKQRISQNWGFRGREKRGKRDKLSYTQMRVFV